MAFGVWAESAWESCHWNGNAQKIGRDQIRANSITPRRIDKETTNPYIREVCLKKPFTVQTGTYTIPDTVAVVICNSASDFTVTLPPATGSGQTITVKNRNTNTVTVEGDSSDNVDGSANTTLTAGQKATFIDYASGEWAIIG